jgi:hypothetical protein
MGGQLWFLALKGLLAGAVVMLISVLAASVKPKMLAGLFGAAPSVAIASLLVTSLWQRSPERAALDGRGMVCGAVGMGAYCALAVFLIPKLGPWLGSIIPWAAWAVISFGLYWLFLR